MEKIKVESIIKDSKPSNTKAQKQSVSDKVENAKTLEGVTPDTRSEVVKLIQRAENSAAEEMRTMYYKLVVKHTFAELRKFRAHYADDKALQRDANSICKRLREGRKVTADFSKIPTQTVDKENNKKLEFKAVNTLHDAFMSLQRSVTALNWERVQESERQRKENEERRVHIADLNERAQNGNLTAEEIRELAALAMAAAAATSKK